MTRDEIIAKMAKNAEIPKKAATSAFATFIDSVSGALKKNDRVQIIGFGTFSVRRSKARAGRNPKTGKAITIPARKRPVFKAGKALKDIVK
jgi:DNA-binding protein HU-beta